MLPQNGRSYASMGDGGIFGYHMAELETALRWGINTVTVINNNHSLNQNAGRNTMSLCRADWKSPRNMEGLCISGSKPHLIFYPIVALDCNVSDRRIADLFKC